MTRHAAQAPGSTKVLETGCITHIMPVSQKLPHGIAEVSTVSVLIRCWLKYQSVNARNVTPLYTLLPFLVHAWEAALQPILTQCEKHSKGKNGLTIIKPPALCSLTLTM